MNPTMSQFAELLARKTQIKNCLAEGAYSKNSRDNMMAELKKIAREIARWLARHAAF